jgi:hypothetical protein
MARACRKLLAESLPRSSPVQHAGSVRMLASMRRSTPAGWMRRSDGQASPFPERCRGSVRSSRRPLSGACGCSGSWLSICHTNLHVLIGSFFGRGLITWLFICTSGGKPTVCQT